VSERCSSVLREVRREIERILGGLELPSCDPNLLDVGCWDGDATARYASICQAEAYGVEVFEAQAKLARSRGIDVGELDLEATSFPWGDEVMDVVIANQVLEHLKNVWLPMAEMFRVLKVGGWLIVSVPNPASLHNRLLLLLGHQPTSIRTVGPHVRGFTAREIQRFVTHGQVLALEQTMGIGLYPLPIRWSRGPARICTSVGHTTIVVARKTKSGLGNPWRQPDGHQTYYAASSR